MPDKQFRDLPAGPELEALVAELVLGWTGLWFDDEEGQYYGLDGASDWQQPPDEYSTDPGAAWQVVEAMERRGWVPCLKRNIERVEWEATFWATPENPAMPRAVRIQADTAPLAICRAALAALEATQ